jgi:hypothetical protein
MLKHATGMHHRRAAQMTRGILELAFMITTKLKITKLNHGWNRRSHRECCNASPGGDDKDGMHAMINMVDNSHVCRESWVGAHVQVTK